MADLNFPQDPYVGQTYSIGTRTWQWNGSGWALQSGILSTNPFRVVSIEVTTTTNSTSTNSGAIIVAGGGGFGGNIYAANIYANGSSVVTTATIGNFGVSAIVAGTDTSVAIGVGNVYTIWNTSTLQSVTDRGATTTNNVRVNQLNLGPEYYSAGGYTSEFYLNQYGIYNEAVSNNQLFQLATNVNTVTGGILSGAGVGGGGMWTAGGGMQVYSAADITFTMGRSLHQGSYPTGGTNASSRNIVFSSTGSVKIYSNDASSGTSQGALVVNGGVGVAGNLYAGGLYDNSIRVVTNVAPAAGTAISITSVSTSNGAMSFTINNEGVTSLNGTTYLGVSAVTGNITLTNLGVTTLTAGTDTAVSQSTGTITVWSTSTLQSITNRGSATSNAISISNATGSSTSTGGALTVTGGVGIGQNLNVGGTLNVWGPTTFSSPVVFSGTATYVYSTNTYYTDNLIELHTTSTGVNTEWTFDDGKDIGLRFHYFNRTLVTGTNAALVLANDSQLLEFYSSGSETAGGVFDNSAVYGGFKTGLINLTGTGATASSSAVSNQSLTVIANGIGINGASYFANNVGIGGTATLSSAGITNNFTVSGATTLGGAVTANSSLGVVGAVNVTGTTTLSSLGVIGTANITGTTTLSGLLKVTNGTSSAGTGTGAITVAGGVGIGENLNVGGNLYVAGVINATVVGSISTATNLTAGSSGSIPYQTAFGRTSFFGPGTAGDLLVSNGGGSPSFVNTLTLAGTTQATSSTTGALQVRGGVGIAKDLWVDGDIYTKSQQVITTATVNNWANQTAVYAGTDTAVSTSTGNITVWSTSTLQSITNRGAVTNNVITLGNTTNSTSTNSGALIVTGGVGINLGLFVAGNTNLQGPATIANGTANYLTVNGTGTSLIVSTNAQFNNILTATTLFVTGNSTIPAITGNVYAANNVGVQGQLAVTGTSVLSETTVTQNLTVVGTSTLANPVLIGPVSQYISFVSPTTTTNATITLDSFAITDYQTAKYLVQIEDRGFSPKKIHVEEMVLFHDDNGPSTLVYLNTYAISSNQGELGVFDVNYASGNITLTFTPNYTPTQLLVKTVRTAIMS